MCLIISSSQTKRVRSMLGKRKTFDAWKVLMVIDQWTPQGRRRRVLTAPLCRYDYGKGLNVAESEVGGARGVTKLAWRERVEKRGRGEVRGGAIHVYLSQQEAERHRTGAWQVVVKVKVKTEDLGFVGQASSGAMTAAVRAVTITHGEWRKAMRTVKRRVGR